MEKRKDVYNPLILWFSFLTNFPVVAEEKGINNNNWAWATQADKISDMGQELSHVNILSLFKFSFCMF